MENKVLRMQFELTELRIPGHSVVKKTPVLQHQKGRYKWGQEEQGVEDMEDFLFPR